MDWNTSDKDKIFGRFAVAEYESRNDKRAIPLLLGNVTTAPFRNLAVSCNRIFTPRWSTRRWAATTRSRSSATHWTGPGSARPTRRSGSPGGQPIPGLSSIGLGQRADVARGGRKRHQHRGQDLSDQREAHLAQGAPLGEVRRADAALRAGAVLRREQRPAGFFGYTGAFSGAAFSDFLLDQVSSKGRGSLADPWTHLHNRVALYVQDDFKATPALT